MSDEIMEYAEDDFWDMTGEDRGRYAAMLDRLKKNEEKVPMELLKTRYRKGYDALRNDLRKSTCQMVRDVVFHGLLIRTEDAGLVYAEINRMIKDSGIMGEISRAVFREKNLQLIEENVMALRESVHSVAERRLDDD